MVWHVKPLVLSTVALKNCSRMLTSKEKDDLLAVESGLFPDDADLGRVDTRKATIFGQAWVKLRRAKIMRETALLV
ncbi:hypothetical protein [Synechococcus sp. BIOS-U3-1]|uniref:hypothetical protein n=1 Tax=Synechococcus sp. BIOS-U3-1 TaxID=1400865 RepID=UPI0016443C95|nr:hypothetical protein [Synechococcus sp. BIOS-U3-1]